MDINERQAKELIYYIENRFDGKYNLGTLFKICKSYLGDFYES